jgi:hypothetical protein
MEGKPVTGHAIVELVGVGIDLRADIGKVMNAIPPNDFSYFEMSSPFHGDDERALE